MKRVVKDIVFLGLGNVNISKIRWGQFPIQFTKALQPGPRLSPPQNGPGII